MTEILFKILDPRIPPFRNDCFKPKGYLMVCQEDDLQMRSNGTGNDSFAVGMISNNIWPTQNNN